MLDCQQCSAAPERGTRAIRQVTPKVMQTCCLVLKDILRCWNPFCYAMSLICLRLGPLELVCTAHESTGSKELTGQPASQMLAIDSGLQHTAGKIRNVMNDGTALLHPRVGAIDAAIKDPGTHAYVGLPTWHDSCM